MLVVCMVFVAVVLVLVVVLLASVGLTIVVLRDMLVPVPMLAVFVVIVAFALFETSVIGLPA